MNALATSNQSISEDQFTDTTWHRYFDIKEALRGLNAHIGSLPSDQTPEKHTRNNYIRGIRYFIEWAGGPAMMKLPTKKLIKQYIAHLLQEKQWTRGGIVHHGIAARTAQNGYLVPLRHFLSELHMQQINVYGAERDFIADCRNHIIAALGVNSPRGTTKTNIAPLWNPKFTRLNINQVNEVLTGIDQSTLIGARDYAFVRLMFESAFRIAEVQRITLAKIAPEDNYYLITVRGKRNNIDPIAISGTLYDAIIHYVNAYNNELMDEDDPRRITQHTPIFQSLRKGDNIPELHGIYNSHKGLSQWSMRQIIKQRTYNALGEKFTCNPHDCRRTFAYIAYTQGMDVRDISKALRHADISITWKYIGTQPNNSATLLTNIVQIA